MIIYTTVDGNTADDDAEATSASGLDSDRLADIWKALKQRWDWDWTKNEGNSIGEGAVLDLGSDCKKRKGRGFFHLWKGETPTEPMKWKDLIMFREWEIKEILWVNFFVGRDWTWRNWGGDLGTSASLRWNWVPRLWFCWWHLAGIDFLSWWAGYWIWIGCRKN